MIKTHKPRGHIWSCPSLFQQSEEIRNILFEDCTPPPTKVLVPDSGGELSAQRAVKRRKIEQLADDYLNGQPLVILSARPHPSTLRRAVEGSERARTAAKYALPPSEVLDEDDAPLWKDVDDLPEILAKARDGRHTSRQNALSRPRPQRRSAPAATETVVKEQASSACKQTRHVKAVKVSLEPSTDAMARAAALRDRRLLRAATAGPLLPGATSSDTIDESDQQAELHSEPASMAQPRYFHDRKTPRTEWLLRRQTTLYELHPDDSLDESLDELDRSGMETPTRATQRETQDGTAATPHRVKITDSEAHVSDDQAHCSPISVNGLTHQASSSGRKSFGGYREHWECFHHDPSAASPGVTNAPLEGRCPVKGSYHTAPEISEIEEDNPIPALDSQADSQTRLLHSHGVYSAAPRSWATTNGVAPTPAPAPALADAKTSTQDDLSASMDLTSLRQSVQESAQHAGKPKKSKRAKSAGNQTAQGTAAQTRRQSAPTQSQKPQSEADQPLYAGIPKGYTVAALNNDTPLLWRKRASRAESSRQASETTTTRATRSRRPVKFLSSEENVTPTGQGVPEDAPILNLSIGNVSFASKLKLTLADEHLNAVLPAEPGSTDRSSAVKRAIRQEFREAKAVISRVEGEPASSQLEGLTEARGLSISAMHAPNEREGGADDKVEAPEKEVAQTQWPGTQALLSQARHDFFDSPAKVDDTGAVQESTIMAAAGGTGDFQASVSDRQPLKTLSQEPAPEPLLSTQALIGSWSPWSTIKKPKNSAMLAQPNVPSPALATNAGKEAMRDGAAMSGLTVASDNTDQRRSGLRFSLSTTDSPTQTPRLPFPITKAASQSETKSSKPDRTFTPKSILRRASSSQHAQPESVLPLTWDPTMIMGERIPAALGAGSSQGEHGRSMFREDSNVDRTIAELETSVLSIGMDGVLSQ